MPNTNEVAKRKGTKPLYELKISPAPWKYIGYHYHKNGEYVHLGEVVNAGLRKIIYDLDQPTARFIAAAPKMYAKAWELITAFDNRVMSPEHIEALRAALAEAAGEGVGDGK